jgi:SNF2 family DNA or RNA helicase
MGVEEEVTAGVTRKSLKMIHDSVEYWPHQLDGIRAMARMSSFLLADEMGLGKSLQALTVAAIDFELERANRVLIVAPVSLKWNWLEEIKTHTNFTAIILDGTPAERDYQMIDFIRVKADILIVNYEQVTAHLNELNRMGFDIIIYDEAHYIKNHSSKRTKACLELVASRHFLLTGSPLLNQVNELWPLLHRIAPDQYPRFYQFVNRYAIYGGWKNKTVTGTKNKEELAARLQEVMIRRLKKDVLDLPEKQHIKVPVILHPLQRRLYDQAANELEIELPNNPTPMELENALVKQLKLKQICGTTATIEGYEDISVKLDRAEEMIEEMVNNGEHVVVFTQFRIIQACMARRLEELKPKSIKAFQLHGDVPKQQRMEVIKQWENSKDDVGRPGALVCMIQVAGVGYNFTIANKAIFLDRLYVPKLNEQGEDRLHRIGSDKTKPVQIYTLSAVKTIEQRIDTILRTKTKLFDSLVEESDWKRALYQALREQDEDD